MIYIDNRENRSPIPQILENLGNEIIMKQLAAGDYIILADDGNNICMERKTAKDFIDSILDGRYNNQAYAMSTQFEYYFLLIEGSILELIRLGYTHPNLVLSSLAGAAIRRSPDGKQGICSIIPTLSHEGTAQFIHYLNKKIKNNDTLRLPRMPRVVFDEDDRSIALLSIVPNVGEKKAKLLLEKFGSPEGVFNASFDELTAVKSIGKKIAYNINETFRRKYNASRKTQT